MAFDVNKVCRVCLEEGVLTSVFSADFGIMPCHMLMQCSEIKIQMSDGMPPHICNNCIYRLGAAYHFKQQCENSDLRLRHYLGLEFKPSVSSTDAATNTETVIIAKPMEREVKKVVPKRRIRKANYKRKTDDEKLKRGPKPKPREPQTCFECAKSFKCAAQLEMHIRIHTGERPFACDYCPRRFAQKHNLSIHVRTHTGEKPFQCEICSKQFSALGNFQSHKKIHTGVRDQICPMCNKAFIASGDLARHMVTHTGVKNHTCDVCSKSFYRRRDMVTHKSKVHNIERPGATVAAGVVVGDPMEPLEPQARRPAPPLVVTPLMPMPLPLPLTAKSTPHPSHCLTLSFS